MRGVRPLGQRCIGPQCDRNAGEWDDLCVAHQNQRQGKGYLTELNMGHPQLTGYEPLPDLSEGVCAGTVTDFTEVRSLVQAREYAQACARCPLIDECLDYAQRTWTGGDPFPVVGVWGGTWFQIKGAQVPALDAGRELVAA